MRGTLFTLLLLLSSSSAQFDEAVPTASSGDIVSSPMQPETTSSSGSRTVIGGMAVTFGLPDWKVDIPDSGSGTSACTQQVERIAARYGTGGSLKISPYFFYTWAMPTDAVPTEDKYYRHSVVRWLVRDGSFKQVEPTGEHLSQYRLSFGTCVRAAISAGFKHIFISPMIDGDYNQPGCCVWRNAAEFDPTEKLPGAAAGIPSWSYETLILQPTMAAVKSALEATPGASSSIDISWSLGAEQGRSFTVFASKWQQLAQQVQAGLRDAARNVWVGPNFDPNKLCGYYCDMYSNSTKVTDAQWSAFRSLLRTCNEFGVSSYPNVWQRYDPNRQTLDVSQSVRQIDSQLKSFARISVQQLRRGQRQGQGSRRFVLNELGFGGCQEFGCDGTNTPDIYELSVNAYNGQGSYESYATPPVMQDPFRHMWTKSFRMEWYRQHLAWFRRDSRSMQMRSYSPDAAYIWSVGSWDVGAIYHPSSKGQNPDSVGCDPLASFCDPDVLSMIRAFNKEGSVPAKEMFALPGAPYYKPKAAAVRSATVSPASVALPVDPLEVPGWAQPALFARPVWG